MTTFDFTNTLALKLTRFFVSVAGFWTWEDQCGKFIMDLAMSFTIFIMIIALILPVSEMWYTRHDFERVTYAASNAMTPLLILLKLTVFFIRRTALVNLIKFCYDKFWLRDYDTYGTRVMRESESRCDLFVGIFMAFTQCTVCSYTVQPILASWGKNETDRILLFTIWLDIPATTTPYYEILFFFETILVGYVGVCYFCFDSLLCIMNVNAAGQFRILQRKFELVCNTGSPNDRPNFYHEDESNDDYNSSRGSEYDGDQYSNFKDCVRDHQTLIKFTKMIEDLWTLIILFQTLVLSLLICLITYQAALVDGTPLTRRLLFTAYSGGSITQLFMFSVTCDDLMRESQAVAEAAYRARWYCRISDPVSSKISKDLIIVIMRARRPCCLTAAGFFPISLETFTTILKTSFSYLTLLRQSQEANETN